MEGGVRREGGREGGREEGREGGREEGREIFRRSKTTSLLCENVLRSYLAGYTVISRLD